MTTPTEYVLYSLFIDTFAARTDDYVENSAAYVHAALTPEVIAEAFAKGRSISGFSARQSPMGRVETNVGVIDFDHADSDDIHKVKVFLDGHDIPALLVASRRGGHLWTFHQGDGTHGTTKGSAVPASIVRRALEAAVELTSMTEGTEVFPKASAKPGGWGAVRMPLFRHPKNGYVYPAHLPTGPTTDLLALVNYAASLTTPWEATWRLAGGDLASVDYPRDVAPYRAVYRPHGNETLYPSVVEQLEQMGVVGAAAGHSVRCPFHADRKASLSIARDDERAFCKAPTCPLYNDGRGMGSITLFKQLQDGTLRVQ